MSDRDVAHINFENPSITVPGVEIPLEDGSVMILRCDHCGDRTRIDLPMVIELFSKKTGAYITLHEDCEPQGENRDQQQPPTR